MVKSGGVEKVAAPWPAVLNLVLLSQLADVFSFSAGKLWGKTYRTGDSTPAHLGRLSGAC